MFMIPYGHQDISDDDIASVIAVLRSDWLTQGPTGELFEHAVAKYCGARYAVAVSSATAALHLSCRALGLGEGDILWTSPNTFVASANCGLYCGATVDFVDIDPRTYNISVQALEEKLGSAKRAGRLPKILVPVHFGGQSCEMKRIYELSRLYGFKIIEDASHAIGGRYGETRIGSCEFSDITVFSFYPVKIITTGEGGMALTNREDLYKKLQLLRSHGITRDDRSMQGVSDGPWYYQQIDLGYNYRMTDIQAGLGLAQMHRLDQFVTRRHELASRYTSAFASLPVVVPWQHPDAYSAYHLYPIRIKLRKQGKTRRQVFEGLRAAGIGVNVHYIPVHTQPYYTQFGFKYGDYPEAERYYEEALSLPLYFSLSIEDQDKVIAALTRELR
jgi:UDP-4-amino-4,6-dideoxy-N-acetyl-beta-L-altrosamine transaminase